MIKPAELVAEARKLLKTQFQHQGRGASGLDCIGMVLSAAEGAGLDILKYCGIEDNRSYGRDPSPLLGEITQQHGKRLRSPIAGCLMVFQMPGAKYPHHFAIYTADNTIIHAESYRMNSVVENAYGAPWTRLLHSMWAIPGVDYE